MAEGRPGQSYRPNSQGFCKVIIEDTIENRKLRLPKSFIKKHGKNLCNLNFVYLVVPTGDEWKVSLQISDDGNKIWLENVEIGHLLTFKYEFGKPNKFKVEIYNNCTLVFHYPIRPSIKVEIEDDDDDGSPVNKSSSSSSLSGFRSSKKRLKIRNQEASPSNIGEAEYPFFEVVIKSSNNLQQKNIRGFVKKNLNSQQTEQSLTFKTKAGRSWPVKLLYYPENYTAKLGAGLADFLKDNSVEVGDLCTFELINREQNLFMVSISKGNEDMKKKTKKKKQIR